jgi:hypothetical protein
MTDGNQLILACTSCRFAHYLTLGSVLVMDSAVSEGTEDSSGERAVQPNGRAQLVACLGTHATALSLRDMDVFEDLVLIRCAECRRAYTLRVTSFETHQK